MENRKYLMILLVLKTMVLFTAEASPDNPEWINFTYGADVEAVADDGEYLWIGGGGVTRLNKMTGEMTFYNKANSGLPVNRVSALAVDAQGNVWIGTYLAGLAMFDGTNWTVYSCP